MSNFFDSKGFGNKFLIIFSVHQPWLELRLFNMGLPRHFRQLLRMLDLSTEFFLGCLWFNVSGSAVSDDTTLDWREVEACEPQPLWISLVISVIFAFVVKIIVTIPVMSATWLRNRNFVTVEASNHHAYSNRVLCRWRLMNRLSLLACFIPAIFCSTIVASFWANVSWDAQRDFGLSCLIYICQWYVFEPFEKALVLASLTSIIAWAKPDFVRDRLARFYKMSAEAQAPSDVGDMEDNSTCEEFSASALPSLQSHMHMTLQTLSARPESESMPA